LLFLESEDPAKDIYVYVNSPGGLITSGLAIYDTMQYVKPDIATICIGQAASMGPSYLRRCQGKAVCPSPRTGAYPSAARGAQGQATDIEIQAREILRMREEINTIFTHHTGQDLEKIRLDTERDFYMTAEQALKYGIIDQIVEKRA